jgi:hypothetical protein
MFALAALLFWSHVVPAETATSRTVLTSVTLNEAVVERQSPAGVQYVRCELSNGYAGERCAAVGPALTESARPVFAALLADELGEVARQLDSRSRPQMFRPRNVLASTTAGVLFVYLIMRMGVRGVLPFNDVVVGGALTGVSMIFNNVMERAAAPGYRTRTLATERLRADRVLEHDGPTILENTGLSPRESADVYRGFVVALRRATKRAPRTP